MVPLMTIFRPKGVILSHQNIVSATSAAILQLDQYAPATTDILYSYLPLSHTLERCCELSVFMAGGAVGFHSGSLKFADSDMKSLKPTILPAVPKFLNRIYDSCVTTANKERPSFVRPQISDLTVKYFPIPQMLLINNYLATDKTRPARQIGSDTFLTLPWLRRARSCTRE